MGRHNLELIRAAKSTAPILFLEPSCYSMFVEDYRELNLPDTETIAQRCHLLEQFVDELLEREPDALHFNHSPAHVAIHAHCHAKSLMKTGFMAKLAARLPGRTAALLDTGCCGMAGAFGALEGKYDLSLKVAAPLVQQVSAQPPNTVVVASGTSCRHQLEHLTTVHPKHMAELLADAIC
jgi:Fe-S oxidoreductase